MRTLSCSIVLIICCTAAAGAAADAGPSTLDAAVQSLLGPALEAYPDLREAEQRADAARARILQAGAFPETTFALEAGDNSDWQPWEAGELTLGVTQPLGRPSVRSGEREIARLEADLAGLEPQRIRKGLALEIKAAVLDTVHRSALARHAGTMADLAEQVETTVTLKYRGGEAPYAEVLRARLETLKARTRRREAERDRATALSTLARLAGTTPEALPTLPEGLSTVRDLPSLDAVLAVGVSESLAIRAADLETAIAASREHLAARNPRPEWEVGLFVQRVKDQPPFDANDFEGTEGNAWGASVGVSLPLFGRNRLAAARTETAALGAAARSRREALERSIERAAGIAHDRLQAASATIGSYEDALLPELEEVLRAARDQYAFQQAGAADLFAIYATYREARGEYLEALHGAAEDRLALEAAFEPGLAADPKGAD